MWTHGPGEVTLGSGQYLNNFLLEISRGNVPGHSYIHKFGSNSSIDIATVPETIWTEGGIYVFIPDGSPVTLYASSGNVADNQLVMVEGLDANFNFQSSPVTLNGQTQVEIGTGLTWTRCFRIWNADTRETAGIVYIAPLTALTNGKPNDVTQIKGEFIVADQQSAMAIYTVPNGTTGYLTSFWLSILRGNTTRTAEARLRRREFGKVFRTLQHVTVTTTGTNHLVYNWMVPERLSGKTDLMMTIDDVSSNATLVTGGFDLILIDD